MKKKAGHVEDRAKERTTFSSGDIEKARLYVKRNRNKLKKGQTYSLSVPGKGYFVVGDVGTDKKNHVVKTVLGVGMRPPGTIIQNGLLERELVKAAEALFTLEKTANIVAVSLAELNFEKAASAYLGYTWETWKAEDPHTKEAALNKLKTMFSGARGFVNRKGADALSRLGVGNKALAGSRQQAAKSYSQYAKGLENQANQMSNLQHGWGSARAGAKQTQAAQASARSAEQGRMAAQGMSGPMAQAEMGIAKAQQGHANRQLTAANKEIGLSQGASASGKNVVSQQQAVAEAEKALANATTRQGQAQARAALAEQQRLLASAQKTQQGFQRQIQQRAEIRQMAAGGQPQPTNPIAPPPRQTPPSAAPPPAATPAATPPPAATSPAPPPAATSPAPPPAATSPAPPAAPAATPPAPSAPAATPPPSAAGAEGAGGAAAPVAALTMNPQSMAYGALGGAALAGGGYMGYKALQDPGYGRQQMPKYASSHLWHDIKNKSDSMSHALAMYKEASIQYRGRTFPGYNQPIASDKKNKKKMVLAKKDGKVKLVHFGQKGYEHNYSKDAKKNYLTRSAGIRNKSGELTMNDKHSPNYWSRKVLWPKRQEADGTALKKKHTKTASKKKESRRSRSRASELSNNMKAILAGTLAISGGDTAGDLIVGPLNKLTLPHSGDIGSTSMGLDEITSASPELMKEFRRLGGVSYTPDSALTDLGPHYNPIENAVYLPKGSHDAVIAHELGHGTGLRQNKLYNTAAIIGTHLSKPLRRGSYMYGGYNAYKGVDAQSAEEKEKRFRSARNAGIFGLASGVPVLGEEARATYRALKHAPLGNRMEYLKVLAPAYGTYVGGFAVPSALQIGLSEVARRRAENRMQKDKKK